MIAVQSIVKNKIKIKQVQTKNYNTNKQAIV
jgi:hypothetical protein